MLIHFLLVGGMDSILTTDPKDRTEIEPNIDLPYDAGAVIRCGIGRVGPLFKLLGPHVDRLAIVNGIAGRTVSHISGCRQTHEMRQAFPPTGCGLTGTLGPIIGTEAPLSDVRFVQSDPLFRPERSSSRSLTLLTDPERTGPSIFESLCALANDDLQRSEIDAAISNARSACGASCDAERRIQLVLRRIRGQSVEPPAPLPPPASTFSFLSEAEVAAMRRMNAAILRDTLFVLKHRLAHSVFIQTGLWDTHVRNLEIQSDNMLLFAPLLVGLLEALQRERTLDGSLLSSEVGIVISSELGRFPIVNKARGKDHFPEFPAILIGPGINVGKYGETDARMISLPVSLQRGRSSSSPRDVVPTIDDLGATIFHWFGVDDPASLGYLGRRLDFLLA